MTRHPSHTVAPERIKAHALYRQAAAAATERSEFVKAAELYLEASGFEPQEGLYPWMAGLSSFQAGRFRETQILLTHALTLNLDDYQRSVAHLFLGRSADIMKDRDVALAHYAQVDSRFSSSLEQAVRKARKNPYKESHARRVVLDAVQADLFRW